MPSANFDNSSFTIAQVLNFTKQKFPSRFKNAKRDHVKMIKVKKIQYYAKDRPNLPVVQYEIVSSSQPQYKPYASGAKDKRGRRRFRQHSVTHHYDTKILFGNEGMTLSTKKWQMVVGSMRRIPDKIPQDKIGSIFRETSKRWKKKYSVEEYKKKVKSHKRRAKYIDKGDFISQELGINQDFLYRQAYAYHVHNHLYGRNYFGNIPAKKTNPQNIMFFNKHQIAIIKILLAKGILTK